MNDKQRLEWIALNVGRIEIRVIQAIQISDLFVCTAETEEFWKGLYV